MQGLDFSVSDLSDDEYRAQVRTAGDITAFRHVYAEWSHKRLMSVTKLFPKSATIVVGYFSVLCMELRSQVLDESYRNICRDRLMVLLREWVKIPQHHRLSQVLETISKEIEEHDGLQTK